MILANVYLLGRFSGGLCPGVTLAVAPAGPCLSGVVVIAYARLTCACLACLAHAYVAYACVACACVAAAYLSAYYA